MSSRACGARPVEDGFHLRLIVIFEHAENGVEAIERREQSLRIVLANFAGVERGIRFSQHVEERALRFGGIQVVAERGGDALRQFLWPAAKSPRFDPAGNCELVSRKRKLRNFSTELAAALRPSKVKFS